MNKAAQELGRLGGSKSTEAKTRANAKKIRQFWADVRAGKRPAPRKRGEMKREVFDEQPWQRDAIKAIDDPSITKIQIVGRKMKAPRKKAKSQK